MPLALLDLAALVALGRRRQVPWLSYRATRKLRKLIQPWWRVLEFGSGMSTIWLASRAQFVYSVESSPVWYQEVRSALSKKNLRNVHLELRLGDCAEYSNTDNIDDASIDFALIDGDCRDRCLAACLHKVKPGAYIYLDNTDQPGDRPRAEAALLDTPIAWKSYYNDFAPGLIAIIQGLLVKTAA